MSAVVFWTSGLECAPMSIPFQGPSQHSVFEGGEKEKPKQGTKRERDKRNNKRKQRKTKETKGKGMRQRKGTFHKRSEFLDIFIKLHSESPPFFLFL